jgi:hypothetical protein
LKTDEKEQFDKDKYSLTAVNDWRVLIESDDTEPVFNQFKDGDYGIKNSYDWLFDDIENLKRECNDS